jgi:hypothetical protein
MAVAAAAAARQLPRERALTAAYGMALDAKLDTMTDAKILAL